MYTDFTCKLKQNLDKDGTFCTFFMTANWQGITNSRWTFVREKPSVKDHVLIHG